MLALRIDRYQTIVAVEIEERDFLRPLQNLERQPAGIMPRNSADDAQALRVDGCREVMLQRRFSCGRERQYQSGKVLGDVPARYRVTGSLPVAAQVRMSICSSRSRRGCLPELGV